MFPTFDHWHLALSTAMSCLTMSVLLEVAKRIRGIDRGIAHLWWYTGAFAIGTGLWGAHFVAMEARVAPIAIGYAPGMTFVSWLCAVGAAALALAFGRRRRVSRTQLASSAFVLSLALCIAHRTAIASIELAPGMRWDGWRSLAAIAASAVCAATLLAAVIGWRNARERRSTAVQIAIAIGLGGLLTAVTALALGAAHVPAEAVRSSVSALGGDELRQVVLLTVPLLLVCTLLSSFVYGRVDRRRSQLAGSLESVAARLISANDELRQRATLDPLTNLPNRVLFEDRLEQALLRAARANRLTSAFGSTISGGAGSAGRGLPARPGERLAVLFVDIDGFKPVNDAFGHAMGDEVIREVARRVSEQARQDDTVSRVGGDQFLVLTEGAESTDDCVALALRIVDAVKVPFRIAERNIQISVSIGIVVFPDHGERSKLLAQAEAAMQAAKRAGRGTYALFASHMHDDVVDQLDLINDLRQAIALDQLTLHYQPKIDGRRHVICGVEALLRWQHPVRGAVSPALFIPVAERFGYINTIGAWVVEEACRQMAAWATEGVFMRVAINLSVHQLREPDLVARIRSALARHGVEPSHLLCEITESVAMQDFATTQRTLDELGELGVYLSIDDFGTGYSSLSYLRQLPARQLKIDRTFINDLETSDDAKAIVDGIVRLAHALGLRVVAEGVENGTQRDILLALACDELQGYFFARPMSADSLLAWTHGQKPSGTPEFSTSMYQPLAA